MTLQLLQMIYKRLSVLKFVSSVRSFSSGSPSVLTHISNGLAVVTLNRPKALNSLNLDMIRLLTPALRQWQTEDSGVKVVLVRGEGGKAFCAGGDIRAITETPGGEMQRTFFREEYQLDHLVGSLAIPYISIMNGITMGGGVGISVNGRFRIATEKTVFAMPETGIGLIPDVGGGFFLPRLPGNLGMFLGLTGHRLKGWDCVHAGVATHALTEQTVTELTQTLEHLALSKDSLSEQDVKTTLDVLNSPEAAHHVFSLSENLDDINRIFGSESLETIVKLLKEENSPLFKKALKSIEAASPTSLKVTFRQIREGAKLGSLGDVLKMEQRLVLRCCEDTDFYEGVRATLIDRDNKPNWSPATIEEVSQEKIDHYFSDIGDRELKF